MRALKSSEDVAQRIGVLPPLLDRRARTRDERVMSALSKVELYAAIRRDSMLGCLGGLDREQARRRTAHR